MACLTTLKSIESLQDELDLETLKFMELAPKEMVDIILDKVKELAATEIADRAIQTGDKAPKFSLQSANGKVISSSKLLNKGPLVVTFFRGEWCPYCNITMKALERALPEITARGATLVAISPQSLQHAQNMVQKSNLSFPVLCDDNSTVAKQFRIAYELDGFFDNLYKSHGVDVTAINSDGTRTLPIPATFVIGTDGKVLYSFVDTDYTKRAEPLDIISAIPLPTKFQEATAKLSNFKANTTSQVSKKLRSIIPRSARIMK